MSWYTIGENWIWFLIAAILAFLLGWLLHGLFRRPKVVTRTDVYVYEKELADLRVSKDPKAKARIAELEAKIAGLKADAKVTGPDVKVSGTSPKLVADLQAQLGKLRAENETNLKLIDDLKGGRVQLGDLKAGKIKVAAPAVAAAASVGSPKVVAELEGKVKDLEAKLSGLRGEHDVSLKLIDDMKSGKVKLPSASIAAPAVSASVESPKVVADLQGEVKDLKAKLGSLQAENDANLSLLGDLKAGKVQIGDLKSGKFKFGLPSLGLKNTVDVPDAKLAAPAVDAKLQAKVSDLEAKLGSLQAENDANLKLLGDLKAGKVQVGDLKSGKFKFGLPSFGLKGKVDGPDVSVGAPSVAASVESPKVVADLQGKVADLEAKLGSVQAENDANLKLLGDLKGGKVSFDDLKAGKFKFGLPSFGLKDTVEVPDAKLTGPDVKVSGPKVDAKLEAELAKLRLENDANLKLLGDLKGGKVSFDDFKAGKIKLAAPSASVDVEPKGSGWLQAQLAKLRGTGTVDVDEVSALEAQLSGPDAGSFDVATELVSLRSKRAADQRLIAKLQKEISAANAGRKKKTEAEVAEARTRVAAIAKRTAGDGESVQDDLEEIYGVGPIISEMLHSMDVTSFRQVARFDAEDIETIGDALEVFPDRITRDDWMASARELHKKKYGSDPLKGWKGGSQIDEA